MAPRSRRGRRWLSCRAGLEHLNHRLRGCIYHLGLIRWSQACRRMGHRRWVHCPSRCRCPPPTRSPLRSRPIECPRQRLSACLLARTCDEPRVDEPRTCVRCQGMGRRVMSGARTTVRHGSLLGGERGGRLTSHGHLIRIRRDIGESIARPPESAGITGPQELLTPP